MKSFKRNLKIFLLFSKYSLKTTLQAKSGIFLFTFGKFLRFLMFFLFVFFLVSRTKVLKGYNVNQAIFFYLTFNIIDTLAQLMFREVYRFRQLVVSGSFDTVLVKPYNPFLRILIGGVDYIDLAMLVPYFILTIFFSLKSSALTLIGFAAYLTLLVNALVLAASFHIAVLALGILTTEVDHTIMIYRDLTSLGRFPMEIYKEPLRSIFTFAIPVGVMMSFPSRALFGLLSPKLTFFSIILALTLFFLSLKLWRHALRKYQGWGG